MTKRSPLCLTVGGVADGSTHTKANGQNFGNSLRERLQRVLGTGRCMSGHLRDTGANPGDNRSRTRLVKWVLSIGFKKEMSQIVKRTAVPGKHVHQTRHA